MENGKQNWIIANVILHDRFVALFIDNFTTKILFTLLPSVSNKFFPISDKIFQTSSLPRNSVPPLNNKSYFSESPFASINLHKHSRSIFKGKEQIPWSPSIQSMRISFLFLKTREVSWTIVNWRSIGGERKRFAINQTRVVGSLTSFRARGFRDRDFFFPLRSPNEPGLTPYHEVPRNPSS